MTENYIIYPLSVRHTQCCPHCIWMLWLPSQFRGLCMTMNTEQWGLLLQILIHTDGALYSANDSFHSLDTTIRNHIGKATFLEPLCSLSSGFCISVSLLASDHHWLWLHWYCICTMSSVGTTLTVVNVISNYNTMQIWGQCTSRGCWSSFSDCSANLVYESCDKTYSSFTFLLWRWNTDGMNQP